MHKQPDPEIVNNLNTISNLINNHEYQKALDFLNSLYSKEPNNINYANNRANFLIDIGHGLKNNELIREGINQGESLLKNKELSMCFALIHYNLATGYSDLYNIEEKQLGITEIPKSKNLENAKLHFRKAFELGDIYNERLWVNYGNCLKNIGRVVESIDAYNEALKYSKYFPNALLNKSRALRFFADVSGKYRGAIYHESYQMLSPIIESKGIDIYTREIFENEREKIREDFKDKSILDRRFQHQEYDRKKLSKFELFYIDYCIKNKLFLNFHIHEDNCEESICDPIFIRLITSVGDNTTFYKLAKTINQIKEDYAVARLLLVQSQFKRKDFNNISLRTTFVNTLDYSQFNIYYGLLKSAFKDAYSIFDKIALFINEYLGLGIENKKIYYWTIWEKKNENNPNKDNNYIIRDEILNTKNISLYALYDINKDFKTPYYGKLGNIRNAAQHQKLIIYDLVTPDKNKDYYCIEYDVFLEETIKIMKLAKSAIIYLINFVNIQEQRKLKGLKGKVMPMFTDNSQYFY